MTFDVINSILRGLLTCVVIYKLGHFREMANLCERIGLGFMGGCSFLTVPNIWLDHASPFDGWAASGLTLGALLLLVGRTYRDWKHSRYNAQAVAESRSWLADRGKV